MLKNNTKTMKSIKINIDIVFFAMLILSAVIIYLFYRAWNNPAPSIPEVKGDSLSFFNIDSCTFSQRNIVVVGWALLPEKGKVLNRIYAEKNNGEWIELMSSMQPRRDVSEAFKAGDKYDKSGFIASRHDLSAEKDFTKKIMIVSFDEKGVGHAAKAHCK